MKHKYEKIKIPDSKEEFFHCDICQDQGCQNCREEYKGKNDLEKEDHKNYKVIKIPEDDGLGVYCEACSDFGCSQCGFGRKKKTELEN